MLLKLAGRLQLLHSHIEAKAQRAAASESALAGPLLVYQDVHAAEGDEDARAAADLDGGLDDDFGDDEDEAVGSESEEGEEEAGESEDEDEDEED